MQLYKKVMREGWFPMNGKWKDFKSIFFTTVIKQTQFTFKIDYKFSCPIWIAGPDTNVCMVCVRERESERDTETERQTNT